jgi:uncharacterized repeat protein (TIGR01451 family)
LELLEDRTVPAGTTSVVSNYAALSIDQAPDANGQFWVPPDTNGAAGPTSYVETVNSSVAIYTSKTSNSPKVEDNFIHFFGTVGGLSTVSGGTYSDCAVVYDDNIPGGTPTTGRFIVTDMNVNSSAGTSVFDIAISKSGSPTDLTSMNWKFYQINTGEAGSLWSDYPGNIGYNQDALVVTFNMFSPITFSGHDEVDAISISDMVNLPSNSSLTHTQTDVNVSGASETNGLRPSTEHNAAAGASEWLVSTADSSHINVYQMTNLLTSPSISAPTSLSVASYSGVVSPLQPNGSAITTNIDSRMQKAALEGNTLVAAHAISVSSTQDDIQWYKIDVTGGTPSLLDQGQVGAGNNTYLVFPAIDINPAGNIGMTYTKSGTDAGDFASVYVTGRSTSDPAGTMQTPVAVAGGAGTTNDTLDGREGDLSGINVDPNDGSFWAAAEDSVPSTLFGQGSWGTGIANFTVGNSSSSGSADLSVTPSGPLNAIEGDKTLTYTVVVNNAGPNDATGTVLTDTLGANLKYLSATTSQGSVSQSGNTITASLGTVVNGGSATVTVTAQATEDGTLTNSASVTSNLNDPKPGNNTGSTNTTVTEPEIIPISTTIKTTSKRLSNFTVATFTHANGVEPASAFSATISWGDGTTSSGNITLSGTTYTVKGSHNYKSSVTHTITTTVKETGTGPNQTGGPATSHGEAAERNGSPSNAGNADAPGLGSGGLLLTGQLVAVGSGGAAVFSADPGPTDAGALGAGGGQAPPANSSSNADGSLFFDLGAQGYGLDTAGNSWGASTDWSDSQDT